MNFIGEWFLEDISVCDDVINFFNESDLKAPGETTDGYNKDYKDSTDISVRVDNNLDDRLKKYISELQKICEKYIEKYPWCNNYSAWSITEGFNIQHYKPRGGFKQYHTERVNGRYPNATRHLVFQTYLNDVTDKGETQFLHQKLKFKPEKGKTLIWPADWTHTHRGIPSPSQEKYIATGWYNYYESN
jgi:hypothetical protein